MIRSYQELLPKDFPPDSRVWIYQSNRLLSLSEALQVESLLNQFIQHWTSHGSPVRGYAQLFFGQFVVLMADEQQLKVGGCSTDSSVRMMQELGKALCVDFFNRQLLAFLVKDKIELLPFPQLNYALEHQFISPDTIYFNNLVATRADLETEWLIPLRESWLAQKISLNTLS